LPLTALNPERLIAGGAMASFRGHITFSTALGVAYGAAGFWQHEIDWAPAALGGVLTALGGMLPDLDSDSGVPVREMFGVAALITPLLLLRRLVGLELSAEQILLVLAGTYVGIRYVLAALFKRLTVHRGMFHSVPGMFIAGLCVFLLYQHPHMPIRLFLSGGVMLGFLSHLVLDELCSVDLNGVAVHLNQFAGSALKFFSRSATANLATYALLFGLAYVAGQDFEGVNQNLQAFQRRTVTVWNAARDRLARPPKPLTTPGPYPAAQEKK
jgi:hypothetical protein